MCVFVLIKFSNKNFEKCLFFIDKFFFCAIIYFVLSDYASKGTPGSISNPEVKL